MAKIIKWAGILFGIDRLTWRTWGVALTLTVGDYWCIDVHIGPIGAYMEWRWLKRK